MTEAAAALYAMAPEDFTAARDELVRQLKAAGDRAGAASIKLLRRPTVAAWLLNLVARDRPTAVEAVVDLAVRLRGAQSDAMAGRGGAALRELTAERRQVVQAAVEAAMELARRHGRSVASSHVDELTRTAEAALADDEISTRWQCGLLATAEQVTGFSFGAADVLAVEQRVASGRSQPTGEAAVASARRQVDTADDRAGRRSAGLQRDLAAARASVDLAQEEVERCRSAASSADQAARAARASLKDALRAATRAELAAATAEQAVWADADRASRTR